MLLAAGLSITSELPAQAATQQAATPSAAAPQAKPSQTAAPASGTQQPKARARHKKPAPVAEVPQAPPPPPTLEQSPPTAPRISYQNGQLSIDAHNSTLAQVLRAVQVQTGATMDIPGNANNERVVGQWGPGQPRDVLNTLLNGSKFDYIILGVTGDPGAVQKVILTPRQNAAVTHSAQNNNPTPVQEQMPEDDPQPDESFQAPDTAEVENQNPNPDQPPPPPGGFRRPMQPPIGGQQSAFTPGDPNVVKTPEQLMQELQQMQQQQQQYQEQLNPANQNQPQ